MYGDNRPKLDTLNIDDKITFHHSYGGVREFRTVKTATKTTITDNLNRQWMRSTGRERGNPGYRGDWIECFISDDEKYRLDEQERREVDRQKSYVNNYSFSRLSSNSIKAIFNIIAEEEKQKTENARAAEINT